MRTAAGRHRRSRVALAEKQLERMASVVGPSSRVSRRVLHLVVDSRDLSAIVVGSAAGDGYPQTTSLAYSRHLIGFRSCCLRVIGRHFGANPCLLGAVLKRSTSSKSTAYNSADTHIASPTADAVLKQPTTDINSSPGQLFQATPYFHTSASSETTEES